MSIAAIEWALTRPMTNAAAKAVLVGLANHADKATWESYPSVKTLVLYTALTDRGVQGALKRLVAIGAAGILVRPGRLTVYTLRHDWGGEPPEPPSGVEVAPTPEGGSPPKEVHPRTARQRPPNGTAKTPEPPSGEPIQPRLNLDDETTRARDGVLGVIEEIWPGLRKDTAFLTLSGSMGMLGAWLGDGALLGRDILPAIRKGCHSLKGRGQGPPRSLSYFRQIVADTKITNEQGLPNGKFNGSSHGAVHNGSGNRGRVEEGGGGPVGSLERFLRRRGHMDGEGNDGR